MKLSRELMSEGEREIAVKKVLSKHSCKVDGPLVMYNVITEANRAQF